jgi:hypothetical protein
VSKYTASPMIFRATPSNCGKLLLSYNYRPILERAYTDTPGKLGGYGNNVVNRENPQPSPNVEPSGETTDAVQRLNVGGRKLKI